MSERKDDRELIKELLRLVESSGGKDLEHRTIASGMHKDYSAHGAYGLMPLTAKEYATKLFNTQKGVTPAAMIPNPTPEQIEADKKYMQRREVYQKLKDFDLNPYSQNQFKNILTKHPEVEDEIVNSFLDTVKQNSDDSLESAIINWEKGQYSGKPSFKEKMTNPRVLKAIDYLRSKNQKVEQETLPTVKPKVP